ncbi:MAG: glycosyltransferase family 2 protein [Pseudomonadota bacterium]
MASHFVACTMKNEGPYLLEWIAYHRSIGFDGFLICSNDCSDGTNLMLNRLDAMGIVIHMDNPQGPNMDPQRSAYSKIRHHEAYKSAEWVLVIDADEFLNVKTGDHSVQALIKACPDAGAISPCWKMMGSAGEIEFAPERLVTERFTRGSTNDTPENGLIWGFKTLLRPDKFDYLGVHRPRFHKSKPLPEEGHVRWYNGSGIDQGTRWYENGWRCNAECYGYDLAQINHYAIKSREDFILKRLRGTANAGNNKGRINHEYWEKYDINATEDATIWTAGIRAELDKLLSDPDLAALHRAALDSAHRTLAAQKENEGVRHFIETGELSQADREEIEKQERRARRKAQREKEREEKQKKRAKGEEARPEEKAA